MNAATTYTRKLRRPPIVELPQLEERKKHLAQNDVIAKIQTGKRIVITPVDWEPGKACDIRVTVEGVVPAFASLRTRNKFLTCDQLTAAEDPAALIGEAVRELLENFDMI